MKRLIALLLTFFGCCYANPSIDDVHKYWFGELQPSSRVMSRIGMWFGKDSNLDQEIKERFGSLVEQAARGELNHWAGTAKGRLALILLLDQFPRNIYRNDPKAFSNDAAAQKLTIEGINRHHDVQLLPIERAFFYLPLEHAENLGLQNMSVKYFQDLIASLDENLRQQYQPFYDYALSHRKVIEEYGRFPHRNVILDRPSTVAELHYLQQPGSGF